MFKSVIAYGGLIFGLPLLAATLIMFVPSLLFATTVGRSYPTAYKFTLYFIEGVISVLFAVIVFGWLDVPVSLFIPIILTIVSLMWNSARRETHLAFPATIGIAIGYFSLM